MTDRCTVVTTPRISSTNSTQKATVAPLASNASSRSSATGVSSSVTAAAASRGVRTAVLARARSRARVGAGAPQLCRTGQGAARPSVHSGGSGSADGFRDPSGPSGHARRHAFAGLSSRLRRPTVQIGPKMPPARPILNDYPHRPRIPAWSSQAELSPPGGRPAAVQAGRPGAACLLALSDRRELHRGYLSLRQSVSSRDTAGPRSARRVRRRASEEPMPACWSRHTGIRARISRSVEVHRRRNSRRGVTGGVADACSDAKPRDPRGNQQVDSGCHEDARSDEGLLSICEPTAHTFLRSKHEHTD